MTKIVSMNSDGMIKLKALARKHRNFSLTLAEPHKNPYRDYSKSELEHMETRVKDDLKAAIIQNEVPLVLSADPQVIASMSTRHLKIESKQRNVWRFFIQDVSWIDENWHLFAGAFDFGVRRKIYMDLHFNAESIQRLVSNWYDPNTLINASIASSPKTVSAIKKRLTPGTLVFSLCLVRLTSCQIYFHPDDLDSVITNICAAARKTKWWWQMAK